MSEGWREGELVIMEEAGMGDVRKMRRKQKKRERPMRKEYVEGEE